jgi:tetratricopeptide (TPR) repeat protein
MIWLIALLAALPNGPASANAGAGAANDADGLLSALHDAPSEDDARGLEERVQQAWLNRASASAKLLILRGQRDLEGHANDEAVEDFDAAVTLDPDLAEGWRLLAVARYQAGQTAAAITDIGEALKREPRDFAALSALSRIAEERGDWKGAYEAWLKVLDIDPRTPDGANRLHDLRRHALGEET